MHLCAAKPLSTKSVIKEKTKHKESIRIALGFVRDLGFDGTDLARAGVAVLRLFVHLCTVLTLFMTKKREKE